MTKVVPSGFLSVTAENILVDLHPDGEMCVGYAWLDGGKSPENIAAIQELKDNGMILFYRGLMTEDGEVAGSGWCRSPKGNDYVEKYEL